MRQAPCGQLTGLCMHRDARHLLLNLLPEPDAEEHEVNRDDEPRNDPESSHPLHHGSHLVVSHHNKKSVALL